MKFTKSGVWTVSTPAYMGAIEDIEEAEKCAHREWVWFSKDTRSGRLVIAERCSACIATRVRSREIEKDE